jgi:hypothetical protein
MASDVQRTFGGTPYRDDFQPKKREVIALFEGFDTRIAEAQSSALAGTQWKDPVDFATTGNVNLASGFEDGDVIDGVTLLAGMRGLARAQSAQTDNGIYVVQSSGAAVRATDADTASELLKAAVFVREGTVNGGKQFVCANEAPITVGTTLLTFREISDQSALNANIEAVGLTAAELAYRGSLWTFLGDGDGSQNPVIVSEDARVLIDATGSTVFTSRVAGVITDDGQSNGKGTASTETVDMIYGVDTSPDVLTLLRGSSADTWLGKSDIPSGTSVELDGETITGIGRLQPQISTTGVHGTTSAEGCARLLAARGSPPWIVWNNAEGGQPIEELLPDPPAGNFAYDNAVTAITRAFALYGSGLVWRWQLMAQGESNTAVSNLGELHQEYRAALSTAAQSITGQVDPVRMISFQMSSSTSMVGVRSILDYALANADDGVFFCGGPTYCYPFSEDYIHQTSAGHGMRGEFCGAIIKSVEETGEWLPLHMVSAAVTGANELTVTLSEAAVVETNSVVAAIANHGITLAGGTISAILVSGSSIVITTTGAASSVTAVRAAMNGQSNPRTEANIPRSNIRSQRGYGAYLAGGTMRKWLCQQEIGVGA